MNKTQQKWPFCRAVLSKRIQNRKKDKNSFLSSMAVFLHKARFTLFHFKTSQTRLIALHHQIARKVYHTSTNLSFLKFEPELNQFGDEFPFLLRVVGSCVDKVFTGIYRMPQFFCSRHTHKGLTKKIHIDVGDITKHTLQWHNS